MLLLHTRTVQQQIEQMSSEFTQLLISKFKKKIQKVQQNSHYYQYKNSAAKRTDHTVICLIFYCKFARNKLKSTPYNRHLISVMTGGNSNPISKLLRWTSQQL